MTRKWKRNEVEVALIAAEKALQKLVDYNDRSGIRLDAGERTEVKMRHSEAIQAMKRIGSYFGDKGARGYGLCVSCTHFTQKGCSSVGEAFGKCLCPVGGKPGFVHCYDTCMKHSKEGGGYANGGV